MLGNPRARDSRHLRVIPVYMIRNTMTDAVDATLQGLTPATLWRQFDAIRKIPRPSLNEAGVREHLRNLAEESGWAYAEDVAGNCVLTVPGRGRGAKSQSVALQAHMDMICEKRAAVDHDFTRDPIRLRRDVREINGVGRDVLMGSGTTLGADNGIGLATALAIALEPGLEHPPLQLIMTADEESGMSGAAELDPEMVTARRMINLDAEEDGTIYLSCAGGRDLTATWEVQREQPDIGEAPLRIKVGGLRGGHSGVDIHLNRGNAIKLLIAALSDPRVELDGVRIAAINGGGRDNVIPRTAQAQVWCVQTRIATFTAQLEEVAKELGAGLAPCDSDVFLGVEEIDAADCSAPLPTSTAQCVIKALGKIPDGVLAWSEVIEGLVETSSNLGIVRTTEDKIEVVCLTRSSRTGAIAAIQERMERALEAAGASVHLERGYPGWDADTSGELLKQAVASYDTLFSEKPALKAIHAGLECGIIGARLDGMEMIAIGPELLDVHTPNEALVLDTMPRFWQFVSRMISDLC